MSVTDTSRKHKDGTEPTVAHRDPASTLTKQHRMVAKGMGYRLATSPGSAIYSVVCAKSSIMSNSLIPYGLQPARPLCPWDSPGKNTGVGCHALLQGIFPTQGSNPGLLHCRRILYRLSHQGSQENFNFVLGTFFRPSRQNREMLNCSKPAFGKQEVQCILEPEGISTFSPSEQSCPLRISNTL